LLSHTKSLALMFYFLYFFRHKLYVTKDVLLKLYDHTLELRIWDTRDKIGTRAKFDRPKLFKLPSLKSGKPVYVLELFFLEKI